jgi:mono/diheme cytochrome c family protein
VDFICWPTVGASSIEYYASQGSGIPGWDKVLLVTTLKRGSLYVLPLSADGKSAAGHFSRYFQSENRYRDTAISPDRRTIYIATDVGGLGEALAGGPNSKMADPGAILAFTYVGEGTGAPVAAASSDPIGATSQQSGRSAGIGPQFTAEQAAAGKIAFNANCAPCHGSTMTNGTFAPPLAGEYFHTKWVGQTVRALYDHSRTMPPAEPGSLPQDTYAAIDAYVLEVNGYPSGATALPAGGELLDTMAIR